MSAVVETVLLLAKSLMYGGVGGGLICFYTPTKRSQRVAFSLVACYISWDLELNVSLEVKKTPFKLLFKAEILPYYLGACDERDHDR